MTDKIDELQFDFHLFPDREGNACGGFYLDDTLTTTTKRLFLCVSLEEWKISCEVIEDSL